MGSRTPSPKRKLWHPNNGIVFAANRQSLYPRLDSARAFNSLAEDGHETQSASISTEETNSLWVREVVIRSKTVAEAVTEPIPNDRHSTDAKDNAPRERSQDLEQSDGGDSLEDPPLTSLDFDIPVEAFQAARSAAPGTPESFWSYTLYRGPGEDGDASAKVKVHYCRSNHTAERVCQLFVNEKVLGFDLEWVAEANKYQGARRNVSLIQIASQSRIALFHLALFPKKDSLVPPTFKKIMEDQEITKAGVFIKGDCTRLRNFLGINSKGIFELSHLYKLVKHSASGQLGLIDKRLVSLATQVKDCLRLPMFKGPDVRSSDWSQALRMDQIIYAASDAYASVQLYAILDRQRELLDPTPPLPYHADLNLPIRLADGVSVQTPDESTETEEIKTAAKIPATLSQEYMASAGESIQVEADGDEPVVQPKKPRAAKRSDPSPKDERVAAAESWLKHYRAVREKTKAAPAALRAYHMWHANEDLDPPAIAAILREPPLQTSTVVGYILEAIKLEKLPYKKERLRTEVLSLLPKEVLGSRYKTFLKETEDS